MKHVRFALVSFVTGLLFILMFTFSITLAALAAGGAFYLMVT